MISNIVYRLSAFSDYSLLTYNRDDVIKILTEFDDVTLAPMAVQEVLANGMVSQRMQFSSQMGQDIISIGSERIDIQMTSNRKEGFNDKERTDIKIKMFGYMKRLFSIISSRAAVPYRLAWFTSYVIFEQDDEQKNEFRDRFLKRIDFFESNRLDDMIARYGARRTVNIGDAEEWLNVLLTVNRHIVDLGTDYEIDGYKVDYDINTWQGNRANRFEDNCICDFINKAYDVQLELNKEVLV